MKRVSTREFLRNINAMTEPVEVYSRQTLKGTWLPNTTWSNIPDVPIRTTLESIAAARQKATPSSDPVTVGADDEG